MQDCRLVQVRQVSHVFDTLELRRVHLRYFVLRNGPHLIRQIIRIIGDVIRWCHEGVLPRLREEQR